LPPYWYGGFYGGYYSYPFYFSAGIGPYAPYYYGHPWYYPWYAYDPAASLRLQVTPRQAEVFVDGSYAGTVDDFDGSFQRLRLHPGDHTIEVFLPGHRSLTQRIYLQPGRRSRCEPHWSHWRRESPTRCVRWQSHGTVAVKSGHRKRDRGCSSAPWLCVFSPAMRS
jgi:hypothetical protein